eukprot:8170813-Ditylum_brightwellii.AAC.1
MSSSLTTITEEDDSDNEDSNTEDGCETDELDNVFTVKSNMVSDEENEQADYEACTGILNK